MGAKYDHLIEGWDFAYPEDKLALETHLIVGNYIPERTAVFIHDAFLREHADDGTTMIGNATSLNTTAPTHPRLYTRDRVFFDDDFTRIGRFEWATNVTVDGRAAMMTFNIQGGGRLLLAHSGAYFVGCWLRAAFVYPAGQMIEHAPVRSTESLLHLASGGNFTPATILDELRVRSIGFLDLKDGPLYLAFRRLEERGFVQSRWQEPTSGMPRKYYRLTDRGRTALREALAVWDAMTQGAERVLEGAR